MATIDLTSTFTLLRRMHRCSCSTKALEGFLEDFAGISLRPRPAQRLPHQRRTFGTRPPVRQLSSVRTASPDDAFIPFDLDLSKAQSRSEVQKSSPPTSRPERDSLRTSKDEVEAPEGNGGSASWHAEIEIASPMVQAQPEAHQTIQTTKALEATNSGETNVRSRAETRMLRKLHRVRDGIHHQSKPGKVQDQVESVLKIIESPEGAGMLKSLVATGKSGKEDVAASAKKAATARGGRTKRMLVRRRVVNGKTVDKRQSKVTSKAGTKEAKTETVEEIKSRSARRTELQVKASSSSAAPAVKPARQPRTESKATRLPKELKAREATSEDHDEVPKPKQEPWGVQKSALERKFGETGWQPRKRLSPDTLEGIRALHASNPTTYNVDVLREHFQISPEAIRRVLKSKWKPNPEEIEKRMQRWEKRGIKKWSEMAAQGQKPPKRWRELGVPNPKLKKVAWEGELGEKRDQLYRKAARLDEAHRRVERDAVPSLAGRIL